MDDRIDEAVLRYIDLKEKDRAPPLEEFAADYQGIEKELVRRILVLDGAMNALRPAFLQPMIGQRIGGYRILREIGRGSMGVVYLVERPGDEGALAMKFLPGLYSANRHSLKRFQREAHTLMRLDHPNVVGVHEVGELAGAPFFVMDYVSGESLDRVIGNWRMGREKSASRDPAAIAALIAGVARGLDHIHSLGVIHRDVKPSNVLIDESGLARLADFGLARDESAASLTATGGFLGTPFYCAPEQVRGTRDRVGPWSDTYSLGVTLYEALSLRVPFDGRSVQEIFHRILKSEPPSIRRLNPAVSPELAAVVHKAIEKRRGRRFKSAAELADDLDRFVGKERTRTRPPRAATIAGRWLGRNTWLPVTALLAMLLVFGVRAGYSILLDTRLEEVLERTDNTMLVARREYIDCMDEAWELADTDAERYRVAARKFLLMGGGLERGEGLRLEECDPAFAVRDLTIGLLERQKTLAMPDVAFRYMIEPFFLTSAVLSEPGPGERPTVLYQGRESPRRCASELPDPRWSFRLASFVDGEYLAAELPLNEPFEAGAEVKQSRWIDCNADGRLDVVLLVREPAGFRLEIALSRGEGFVRTLRVPVDGPRKPLSISTADADGDGDADILLVCESAPETASSHLLFLVDRDGAGNVVLTESGAASGLSFRVDASRRFRTVGYVWVDLEGDGDLDFVQAGNWVGDADWIRTHPSTPRRLGKGTHPWGAPPIVLRNDGRGDEGLPRFVDISAEAGLGGGKPDQPCHRIAACDLNRDGMADLLVGTVPPSFFLSDGAGGRRDVWNSPVAPVKEKVVSSIAVVDFDLDGDDDIYIGYSFARDQLLINEGVHGGIPRFRDAARSLGMAGERELESSLSWGTWVDLDLDGDLDLLVRRYPGFDRVYRNDAARGSWLKVFIEGPAGDPVAAGARVTVRAGDRSWVRIQGAQHSGYFRQMRSVHFGLGDLSRYDAIGVTWPDGTETILPAGATDRIVVARHGGGCGR